MSDPSSGTSSGDWLSDVVMMGMTAPLMMYGDEANEMVHEIFAATDHQTTQRVSRYLETVTTYEEQRPRMSTLSQLTSFITMLAAIWWIALPQSWPFTIVVFDIPFGWWLIGSGILLAGVFGLAKGEVESSTTTRADVQTRITHPRTTGGCFRGNVRTLDI